MPKGKLSGDRKEKMQAARRKTLADRQAAAEAIASNPQFTEAKFWKNIDTQVTDAVVKAIKRGQKAAKLAEADALEAKAAAIRATLA